MPTRLTTIKTMMLAVVTTGILTAPVSAQGYRVGMCMDRAEIISGLSKHYDETQRFYALQSDQRVLEFYASPDGSWTAILSLTPGFSCVVAIGEAWAEAPPPPVGYPTFGHIFFIDHVSSNGMLTVIEGNAKDRVKYGKLHKSQLLPNGIVWPEGIPLTAQARAAAEAYKRGHRRSFSEAKLLRLGDSGAEVESLQKSLRTLGIKPALHMYEVIPSDTEDLPYGGARGLRINAGGTLRVTTWSDEVSDITVYDGEEIPCAVKRVHATGTTATGIRAYV